ncbi:MAG: glycosyltransferase family 2 protein [Thermodesulfobacteriota bacterium]
MKVSVVIPALNEGQVIGSTVARIRSLYPDYEIVVVDDGSTDNTVRAAEENGARVVSHPYNIGNGAAVKTGIRNASGDLLVLMDGDGQHDPADIPRLLAEAKKYDLVIGARKGESQATVWRRMANWCYNKLASYVANFKIPDLTSGFRVFHRRIVLKYLALFPNTFSYPTTSTLAYLRSGQTVGFVPIQARKRVGKSKIKLIRDGYRFLLIIIRIATLFSPLKIFLPVSLFFFLTGLGYYGYTFFTRHSFTNMSGLLLSVGVMVFLLGMVSEQITQSRYDRVDHFD